MTLWELFSKNLAIYFLTKLHIIYINIYIYIHICVYIDICQSEIQQTQDHKESYTFNQVSDHTMHYAEPQRTPFIAPPRTWGGGP